MAALGTHPYGSGYQRARANLLSTPAKCAHCQRRAATEADHDPPLAAHTHIEGTGCCRLIPSCHDCARRQGGLIRAGKWRPGMEVAVEEDAERDGLAASDRRWRVAWLAELLEVPPDATWPRLMTVPHPR